MELKEIKAEENEPILNVEKGHYKHPNFIHKIKQIFKTE